MKDEALRLAQRALSNKNASTKSIYEALAAIKQALAQPEQEPVAWMWKNGTVTTDPDRADGTWTPLYTSPPKRETLTDEEIILIVAECAASHQHTDIHFARAIERAHGIKELV